MLSDDRAQFLSMFEDTSRVEDRKARPSHRIKPPFQNNAHSPESLYIPKRNCIKSIVSLELFQVKEVLKIYEWRTKTRSPIVHCRWTAISLNKTSNIIRNKHDLFEKMRENEGNSDVKVQLKVETEKVEPLESFQPFSFANFMYAFKEAIVGFQRLYSLFGPLKILSKMIVVNNAGKVKVWLTTHYDQNFKSDHPALENCPNYESQLLSNFLDIFYEFRQDSPTYRDFFKGVQESETFISLIRYVQDFVASKRILVSKCITLKKTSRLCRHISPEIKVGKVVRDAPYASPRPSVYVKSSSPKNKLLYRANSHAGFLHHTFSSRPFKLEETKETLPSSNKNESDEEQADREGSELRNGDLLSVPVARNFNLTHYKAPSSMNSGQDTPSSIDEPVRFTLKNSIQQKMYKLLSNSDDEIYSFDGNHPEEYEDPSRLSNYGRSVKESIIISH